MKENFNLSNISIDQPNSFFNPNKNFLSDFSKKE